MLTFKYKFNFSTRFHLCGHFIGIHAIARQLTKFYLYRHFVEITLVNKLHLASKSEIITYKVPKSSFKIGTDSELLESRIYSLKKELNILNAIVYFIDDAWCLKCTGNIVYIAYATYDISKENALKYYPKKKIPKKPVGVVVAIADTEKGVETALEELMKQLNNMQEFPCYPIPFL